MPGTRKLGKTTDQRMAMLRQQVTDFWIPAVWRPRSPAPRRSQPLAEKMITLGKKKDLAAYRQALPSSPARMWQEAVR
jgi:large subunit ribosomal protein L17